MCLIAIMLFFMLFGSINTKASEKLTNPEDFTHTVDCELFVTTWCHFCPTAEEQLKDIFENDGYPFWFVSMITDVNDKANDRANDYHITGVPTAEFDGGYIERRGAQSDKSQYEQDIEDCGARDVPDVTLNVWMEREGDDKIKVNIKMKYNDDMPLGEDYRGHIRAYIAEVVSRYNNSEDEPIPFGFLDYAFDEEVTLTPHEWYEDSSTWDASDAGFNNTDYNNLVVILILFNRGAPYQTDEYAIQTAGTLPPNINITAPSNEDIVSKTVTIKANAVGNRSNINKVEYQIDDGNWINMDSKGNNDYEALWDTQKADNGVHEITVKATDDKGTTNYEEIEVTVKNEKDTEKPTLTIKNPKNNEIVKNAITIQAEAKDNIEIDSVKYQIDENVWVEMNAKGNDIYEKSWNTRNVENGKHTIRVRAIDTSDNKITKEITVDVENEGEDTTPPTLKINKPEDKETVSDIVTIEVNAQDENGIDIVEYKIDDGSWIEMEHDSGDIYKGQWNTKDYDNNDYIITVRAKDTSGNIAEKSITVTVDNDKTPPEITITNPSEGDILKSEVSIEANVTDESNIKKVQYSIDTENDWVLMNYYSGSKYKKEWNTTTIDNGEHTIYVRAIDEYDNEKTEYINVKVRNEEQDTEKPTISDIVHTPKNPTAKDKIEISARVTDNVEVYSVKLSYQACTESECLKEEIKEMEKNGDIYSVIIGTFDEGIEINYYITAKDSSGNEEKSDEKSFIIKDKNPPEIRNVYYIPENPTTDDEITIYATIKDESKVELVQIRYDGGTDIMSEHANNQYSAKLGPFKRGKVTFEIIAKDSKGNENETEKYEITIVENMPQIITFGYEPLNPTSEDEITVYIILSKEVDYVDVFYSFGGEGFSQVTMNYDGGNKYSANIGIFDGGKVTFYMVLYQNKEMETSNSKTITIQEVKKGDSGIPGFDILIAISAIGIILFLKRRK